jgi:hypothetical protein
MSQRGTFCMARSFSSVRSLSSASAAPVLSFTSAWLIFPLKKLLLVEDFEARGATLNFAAEL